MTTTSEPAPGEIPESDPAGSNTASLSGESPAGESLSARVRKGALWVVASSLVLRLGNVLITAVVARILSPHDFGVFAVALTAYAIISSLGELGVSSCLIRADLDIDALAPTVTTVSVLSGAVFALAMVGLAGPIATVLGSPAAVGPIRVLAIAVLLTGVFAVPTSQMGREFKQDKIFMANAIAFVPATVLLIVLAKGGNGAMAFAWSMVVRQFTVGFVLLVVAPRYYWPGLARSALSVIFSFGIPLAAANFVNYTLLNVDYAFVGHLLGATLLGIYMLAFTVAAWPSGLLGGVINSVSMPAFSRVKHDPDLLMNAMAASLRAVSLIVMPMCGMMIALAHPLVLTVYGAKWAGVANVLMILAVYSAAFMVCLLFANMLTGLGATRLLLILQLIWIGTLVPAMVLGVHRDGIMGAAYAHVAVIVPIVLPSYLLAIKRVTHIRLTALGKAAMPALGASAVAAVAAYAAASRFSSPLAQLIAGLAAGGVVYFICAGRQAIAIFARGKAAERILGFYGTAARLVGLPADGRARHSARYAGHAGVEALNDIGSVQRKVLADQARYLGTDRVEVPSFGAKVSYAVPKMDWLAQAVALHERTVADRERRHGPDHPHTLASRTNLAHIYRQAGLLAKAIPLYERTLADCERLLGPDHPRSLRCSNYLAAAYCQAGRLAEAIPLYEQTLDARRRLLGADHASTLRSLIYLARAYLDAGRIADAIPLLEQAVEGRRRLFGANHPSTLRSLVYLARAYLDAGRVAEAIPLCERTLAHCSRVLGKDHALTRTVRRSLSDTKSASRRQHAGASRHNADAARPQLISGSPPPVPNSTAQSGTSSSRTSVDVGAEVQE
jgi:lipopolysaccharide exporter